MSECPTAEPIGRAEDALGDLRASRDFGSARRAWSQFLEAWHSACEKGNALGVRRSRKGEWTPLAVKIEADPLLQYVLAARGVSHHRPDPVSQMRPQAVELRMLGSGKFSGVVTGDTAMFTAGPTLRPSVEVISEGIDLLPITERIRGKQRTLQPPVSHLGQAFDGRNPVAVAAAALAWAKARIAELPPE